MTQDRASTSAQASRRTGEGVSRPVGRRPLDRDRILREAIDFIDREGREQLTMRRLGARLGVEAMALYRYVPGREQLLDGVVETLMEDLYLSTVGHELDRPGTSWQYYLERMAHGVRDLALAHPRVFPLIASRPPAAPWLRPPLRSLRWVEGFLEGLAERGFSDQASVVVYRAFSTFLLGHLLLESAGHSPITSLEADEAPPETHAAEAISADVADLTEYPRIQELSGPLSEDGYADEFEDSLEDLINRIAVGHG